MFKLLPERKYQTEMLYFLTEYTLHLAIYEQFIRGSKKKKASSLQENIFENDFKHFASGLKYDYSSSATVSNQRIKLRAIVLLDIRLMYIHLL